MRIDYPVQVDRVLGLGTPPTLRLQRRLAPPGRLRALEKVLVWTHWVWFLVPARRPSLRARAPTASASRAAAARSTRSSTSALLGYWLLPTAPPWYAAEQGSARRTARTPGGAADDGRVRRAVLEARWGPLYSVLGGNPLAAMPSLHFATSVKAAHLLAGAGPVAGALGWTYALTLGLALVYLGEHYVVDLLAGLALTEGVRARRAAPTPRRAPGVAALVQALEAQGAARERRADAASSITTATRARRPPPARRGRRRRGDAARQRDARR